MNSISKEMEERAVALHKKAIVFEAHTHPFPYTLLEDYENIRKGGVTARVSSVIVDLDPEIFSTKYPETLLYKYDGYARRALVEIDHLLSDIENNPDKFNKLITQLIDSLNLEKQEDEKTAIYEGRLFSELSKVLGVELG